MQADIPDFFIINMNLDLVLKFLFFVQLGNAVFNGREFDLAVNDIVARARGHSLGKFTAVIGNQVPGGVLLPFRMDGYPYAIERAVIRPIGCTGNNTIMSFGVLFFLCRSVRKENCKAEGHGQFPGWPISTHCPLLPRQYPRRLRRRRIHLPDSAQVDFW